MNAPVPRVHVGDEVWRLDEGRVLVGGAPLRVLRLPEGADAGAFSAVDEASGRRLERLLDAGVAHPDPVELPEIALDQLTVVIPTLGRSAALERLLEGLSGVTTIVVDDGTPAPEAAELARLAHEHGARLQRLEHNVGRPRHATRVSPSRTTPYVAFVDSDAQITAEELGMLLRHFADPRLALVGPRIVGSGRPTWIARYENARSSLDLGGRPALVRPRSPVSWISSTCLVARREALGDGFRAQWRVAEDVDLVWRLAEEGWRVRYEPRVAARHAHRTRLRPWLARKLFYGTGAAELAAAHGSAVAPAILRPWSAGVLVALLAGRRWSLPVATAIALGAAVRLRRRLPAMPGRSLLALRLTGNGVVSALAQLSALALRHWWPLAAIACLFSRRARAIVGAFAVVDAELERRRTHADLDPSASSSRDGSTTSPTARGCGSAASDGDRSAPSCPSCGPAASGAERRPSRRRGMRGEHESTAVRVVLEELAVATPVDRRVELALRVVGAVVGPQLGEETVRADRAGRRMAEVADDVAHERSGLHRERRELLLRAQGIRRGVAPTLLADTQLGALRAGELEQFGRVDEGQQVVELVAQLVRDLGEPLRAAALRQQLHEAAQLPRAHGGERRLDARRRDRRREDARHRRIPPGRRTSREDAVDLVDEGLEGGAATVARLGQLDRELGLDPPRVRVEHDDAIGQLDGLLDVVRHDEGRPRGEGPVAPHPHELAPQVLAREHVEGENGSSISRTSGSTTRARAKPTRWRIPPESSLG